MKLIRKETGNCVSTKDLSAELGIPNDVIRWHMERLAEENGLVKGEDYLIERNSAYYLFTPAVVWLASALSIKDYRKIAGVLSEMAASQEVDKDSEYKQKYENLLTDVNELYLVQKSMESCFDKISRSVSPKKPKKKEYKKNDECLPEISLEEAAWIKDMQKRIGALAEKENLPFSHVLQKIYSKMRGVYGIVFEQVKKDFFEQNQIDEKTKITTLRLVTYHPDLRSIFGSIVGTMEQEVNNQNK